MKVLVASDIHLEMTTVKKIKRRAPWLFSGAADVVVLAGDIGYPYNSRGKMNMSLVELLSAIKSAHEHVIVVCGNHEYYSCGRCLDITMSDVDDMMRKICEKSGVIFLQKSSVNIAGVTFAGCTLWSRAADNCAMNDFVNITDDFCELLTPAAVRDIHADHVEFLRETRADVIITHHLPLSQLVNPIYRGSDNPAILALNSGYASDCAKFIDLRGVSHWIYGHDHSSGIKVIGSTTYISNALGYPGERTRVDAVTFEL